MKRQWRIDRQFRTAPDGAQRWDQAYQHLLEWAQPPTASSVQFPVPRSSLAQEDKHEHGDLCTCVDRTANPGPDY